MEDYKKLEESMENYKNLIWWMRWMGLGQPGAATYTRMADAFENIITENAALRRHIENLTDAQAVVVKEFETKLEELHEAKSELNAMRNELCCKCGNYKQAHNGACDGCRWKEQLC